MLPDGRIAFLGNELAPRALSQVLLPDAERGGPGKTVPIQLGETPSSAPSWLQRLIGNKPRQRPYVSVLAAGPTGVLWVAGFTNTYTDIASAPHSDAYIAQIEESGKVHWERSFGDGGRRSIESIAAIGAGDLIVAGRDGRQGWIARVGEGGRQVWDLRVGNDKGIAVASLSNDQLVVAGFEATGSSQAKDYRDHVTVWIIDGSGKLLVRTPIRDGVNKSEGSYFGDVSVVTSGNAVYVLSSWQGLFDAQPVQLSKLNADGRLLWSTPLPDTIVAVNGATTTWRSCQPTLALTPDGVPLVACALDTQVHLYRLDGLSGRYQEDFLPLPECQSGHPAVLFLAIRGDGAIVLSGSRSMGNVAANCTWVGRLAAAP